MKNLVPMVMGAVIAACAPSCVDEGPVDEPRQEAKACSDATFLCVGMERSMRFGLCPGCELDARRMYSLLSDTFGYSGSMLVSSDATKENVVEKLKNGIEATGEDGLFIFCYSGHGGQEYLGGKEPDGSDRNDEYLCLYDTYMLDDEIWSIVSKCKGRVFLYFDACHSATMYRSVSSGIKALDGNGEYAAHALSVSDFISSSGFTFNPSAWSCAGALSNESGSTIRMLCWSGCKEVEYSYGSVFGGTMTSSLIKSWSQGITYEELWRHIVSSVQKRQPAQHPVQTVIGDGFGKHTEAFR